jgi:hypothetical protein
MKEHSKTLIWICIVLAFISLAWLGYNSFMYRDIPNILVKQNIYTKFIGYGLLLFFFSHLIIILCAILSSKYSQFMSVAGNVLLVLGAISFTFLLLHFVSLHEIEDDFTNGYSFKSMLKLTWQSQIIMICFFLFSLIYFIVLARKGDKIDSTKSISREQIFVTLNVIGIVCSIVGILMVIIYFKFQYFQTDINIQHYLRRYDIVPYGFIILPYLLVLAGWGIRYFNDRRSGWYDEKQNSNINRSGMVALMVSLPLLIFLTIFCFLKTSASSGQIYISGTITVLWLPFYLFMVLFVFSATALYKFKNN